MDKYAIHSDPNRRFYASNKEELFSFIREAVASCPSAVISMSEAMGKVLGIPEPSKKLFGRHVIYREVLRDTVHVLANDGGTDVSVVCPDCVRADTK